MSESSSNPRSWQWLPGLAHLILQRMQNYTADQLMAAANNLSKSDWHRGRDPRTNGKEFCDPQFLYRNDLQVDKWLNEKHGTRAKPANLQVTDEYEGVGETFDV